MTMLSIFDSEELEKMMQDMERAPRRWCGCWLTDLKWHHEQRMHHEHGGTTNSG